MRAASLRLFKGDIMGKAYIPLSEANKKAILNFIAMCKMNGLEGEASPTFNFKDIREDLGTVILDLYYDFRGIDVPCWKITIKTDTECRIHDDQPAVEGETYSYVDTYQIAQGSTEFEYQKSRFSVFAF